ncbi:MAG: PQQ-dependent sugar dehydrogenase [Actinomycetota bacterium]
MPRSTLVKVIASVAALALAVASCASSAEVATDPGQTPAAAVPDTATSTPEVEAAPTAVPEPTEAPVPSASPGTPVPTTAPIPTPTNPATPTANPTPSPEWHTCAFEPSGAGPSGATPLRTEVVVDGLEIPWGLVMLPDGDLLITERPGRVRLVDDGVLVEEPVLEIGVSIAPPLFGIDLLNSEGGLLGILLHPEFEQNRFFYIFANVLDDEGVDIGRIDRYVLAVDGRSAELDRVILDDLPAGVHHQGGRMHVGPDGHLYVGVGAFEPFEAQDPDSLAGKLLRIDLDGGIPADNPDPTSPVFVRGIRNSQGFDWFDDDHLVMVDHGPSGLELDMPDLRGFDEINVVRAGQNLGWPRVWGCDQEPDLVSPVLTWATSVPPTGAAFYRGDAIPEWTNSFLFTVVGRAADGQHLHRVEFAPGDPYTVVEHEVYLPNEYGRLRTIVEAPDGSLYVMTSNCDGRGTCPAVGDRVIRIGPAG